MDISLNKADRLQWLVPRDAFFATLLFIALPLYAVPLIVQGMWKRKKWAFVLWAFFMGLVGILVPPTGDFYRYTQDFYAYEECDWESFVVLALLKNDFMLPLLSYVIGLLHLNFDLSRFIYNFWGYYLLGSLFLDIVRNNEFLQQRKIVFYALGFFIAFSVSNHCFRYGLSTIFFMYGAYQLVYKEKKWGWWFVGLAIFNHLSFVIQGLALLLRQMHFFRFGRKMVVFMILVSLFMDSSLIINAFSMLPVDIVSHYMVYLDGHWAEDFVEDHSWKWRMQQLIGNLINYACVLVYILFYRHSNKKSASMVNSMLFLTFLTTPFVVLNSRFMTVMMGFIKIHYLVCFDGGRRMLRYLRLMFWLVMLTNLMGLWEFRRQFSISDFPMMLTSSSIAILNHTYHSNWIDRNVAEDGDLLQINY